MLLLLTVVLAAILLLLGVLLYKHVTRNFSYWKERNIPFVKPIPIFGNALKVCVLQQSIGHLAQEMYNKVNSQFVGFFIFDQPFLLIRDPEMIKNILVKDFDHFDNRTISDNIRDDPVGSYMLFIVKNPVWKAFRTKMTVAFTTGKLKGMLPLILEASQDLTKFVNEVVHSSTVTDSREMAMKYTADIISSCGFGILPHSFGTGGAEFHAAASKVFSWNIGWAVQMACYFIAPFLVKPFKMTFVDPRVRQFLHNIFWEHMDARQRSECSRGDLIDILAQLKKNDHSKEFEPEMFLAQAIQFFIAGFETSGSTLSFTLYELSKNVAVQDEVRKEIRSVFKANNGITYEALLEMKLLTRVISETLRMYPVLPFLDRRCTKTYTIPGTDHVLAEGVPVYISLLGLHHDPEYFPDPYKYDPDRFTEENKLSRPSYTYMPFGEGPHNCVGRRLAMMSTKIGLVQILKNFEVELCSTSPVPMKIDPKGFLLAPVNGVDLRFKRCEDSPDILS